MKREVIRIIVFLFIIGFYFNSKIGFTLGVLHLILAFAKPKQFGMSKLIQKLMSVFPKA